MPRAILKDLLIPGSVQFLLLALVPATLLLFRRKDGGRAGKILIVLLLTVYLLLSIPLTAVPIIGALTPSYPAVQNPADAHGATAIVVLSAGMETYRSRGELLESSGREDALRLLEAARVYHVLDRPWVITTGGDSNERMTQAEHMARVLVTLGVDADRIVEERYAQNTRDHALLVPPILKELAVQQFVLVTSRQHMARALAAFKKVGWDPVPSSPELYVARPRFERYFPGRRSLDAASALFYDEIAMVYYWVKGWV